MIPNPNKSRIVNAVTTVVFTVFITIGANFNSYADEPSGKGLFTIQFSWNSQSFSNKVSVDIEYKKVGILKKSKVSSAGLIISPKNNILSFELADGEYEFEALRLKGPEFGYGKYLNIPFEKTFKVKSGQITNGGLFFIGKQSKDSNSVYHLILDNTLDIERYVSIHHKAFAETISTMEPAWPFLEESKLQSIIDLYIPTLIESENLKARPKVTLLFTTLGIVLHMNKDSKGQILDYQVVKTPSYQDIVKMKIIGKKLLCTLGSGDYWYGTTDGLEYMSYPGNLERYASIFSLGGSKFLMVDANFNLHYTLDATDWSSQTEFAIERKYGLLKDGDYSYPKTYFGNDNMYVYSTASGRFKILLRSPYETINFQRVALTKDVKEVPMVTETKTQLILGPDLKIFASAKRPGYLYVQNRGELSWRVVDLPRGDCNRFVVSTEDNSIYSVQCGGEIIYDSYDHGNNWEIREAKK